MKVLKHRLYGSNFTAKESKLEAGWAAKSGRYLKWQVRKHDFGLNDTTTTELQGLKPIYLGNYITPMSPVRLTEFQRKACIQHWACSKSVKQPSLSKLSWKFYLESSKAKDFCRMLNRMVVLVMLNVKLDINLNR